MIYLLAVLVLAGASVNAQTITQTFGTGANAFSIDFVEISNPGNTADSQNVAVGSVNYIYYLGKYEISRAQIEKSNLSGNLAITLEDMTPYGGNGANRPATGVSWNEAIRFVNWLNTSTGSSPAYNLSTEGNFQLWNASDLGYQSSNPWRNCFAKYFLPNVDEWHKGAFGSPSGAWYQFASGSDSPPLAVSSGTSAGTAVYDRASSSPADVNNAGGESPFGTMAQGGNVWEWTESGPDYFRWIEGGFWNSPSSALKSTRSYGQASNMSSENFYQGFRIASVPEPSSLSLLLAGGVVLMAGRRGKV